MGWVKAKDRLPTSYGRYRCRLPNWGGTFSYSNSKLSYFNEKREVLEWWEEENQDAIWDEVCDTINAYLDSENVPRKAKEDLKRDYIVTRK